MKARNKIRCITGAALFLLASILCSHAHATHIQYVDLADVSSWAIGYDVTKTWTFDLINDSMYLWEIDSPTTHTGGSTPDVSTTDVRGSYNSDYDLHYVTLRIDPNNYTGVNTSMYLKLVVNDIEVEDWSNPIRLYDWGVPGDPVSDPYGIAANDYQIIVTLTGRSSVTIEIDNVNLEGCFDTAIPVPEPATMLLLGSGLISLAGLRKKLKK